MRIVSWNCSGKFHEKYQALITYYNPDIMIIPECENPLTSRDLPYKTFAGKNNYQWIGKTEHKGLAVFSKKDIPLIPLSWPSGGHNFFLPVNVDGRFDLIACWPGEPYIEELYDYLILNEDRITENTVISGDLNSNPLFDTHRKEKTHMDMVRLLESKGLVSAYHYQTNEEHGHETKPTFYLYRNPDKAYHIDYCFLTPGNLKQIETGNVSDWMGKGNPAGSDHLPLKIDIND